jgi:glycosyltransferase involved in cell wall biosynthesis
MLSDELKTDGVELRILYGVPSETERSKGDNVDLPDEIGRRIPSYYMASDSLLLQWPGVRNIAHSDLIIVVNANRNLLNFILLLISRLGLKKVALWGHGCNHQGVQETLSEHVKKILVMQPRWWFAYTSQTAQYITSLGFDANRITVIDNAIDTSKFSDQVRGVTAEQISAMREKLNLSDRNRIGLYCGSLYSEKRIPFLLRAAKKIASQHAEFKLIIIGGGVEELYVRELAKELDYIRYVGPMFGLDKSICYRMSEVVLNPGLVGLGILDSFAAGIPFVTMYDSLHSPEIAYLEDKVNGLMIEGEEDSFAAGVLRILEDDHFRAMLQEGAEQASRRYTVENMVNNVKYGILKCLKERPSS